MGYRKLLVCNYDFKGQKTEVFLQDLVKFIHFSELLLPRIST